MPVRGALIVVLATMPLEPGDTVNARVPRLVSTSAGGHPRRHACLARRRWHGAIVALVDGNLESIAPAHVGAAVAQ